MKDIIKELVRKKNHYELLAQKAEKSLETNPQKGKLRISYCRGVPQYYFISEKEDTNGIYIPKSGIYKAKAIAQRDYDKKVYRCANKYITVINRFLNTIPQEDIRYIETKSVGRRKLIEPYELSDEEYVRNWQSITYKGKRFDENASKIITERGERVRSKTEKIIADKLYLLGIPYRYEYPLRLKGYGTVYPDFTLLNTKRRKEILLEHLGMMDDPSYSSKAMSKMDLYTLNNYYPGKDIIYTYETSKTVLNLRVLLAQLEEFVLK